MGRFKKWTDLVNKRYDDFFVEIEKNEILNFKKIFENSNPVHIEIGAGRGEFISQKALLEPNINFLAIELQMKRVRQILLKLDPKNYSNVRISNIYIDDNIDKIIAPNSIDGIYIQHPDPWPKRKHHKNRLFQEKFINSLHQILTKGSLVKIATDHQEYSKWIMNKFEETNKFAPIFKKGFTKKPYSGHIETYFEQKKRQEGFPPIFMHFRKV